MRGSDTAYTSRPVVGEVLRPDFAVRDPGDDESRWQLLVQVVEPGGDFDRVAGGAGRLEVSAHGRPGPSGCDIAGVC